MNATVSDCSQYMLLHSYVPFISVSTSVNITVFIFKSWCKVLPILLKVYINVHTWNFYSFMATLLLWILKIQFNRRIVYSMSVEQWFPTFLCGQHSLSISVSYYGQSSVLLSSYSALMAYLGLHRLVWHVRFPTSLSQWSLRHLAKIKTHYWYFNSSLC